MLFGVLVYAVYRIRNEGKFEEAIMKELDVLMSQVAEVSHCLATAKPHFFSRHLLKYAPCQDTNRIREFLNHVVLERNRASSQSFFGVIAC